MGMASLGRGRALYHTPTVGTGKEDHRQHTCDYIAHVAVTECAVYMHEDIQ